MKTIKTATKYTRWAKPTVESAKMFIPVLLIVVLSFILTAVNLLPTPIFSRGVYTIQDSK